MTAGIAGREIDLGLLDRIPAGEGRAFEIDGRLVAVFRDRAGAVRAVDGTCPHRGGPLADGLVGDGRVQCPLHAFQFDLRTGHAIGRDCAPVRVYPARVDESGRIRVEL